MVPNPTRFRHILLILLLLMLMAALPLSASAATTGTITASANHVTEGGILQLSTNMSGTVTWTSSSPSTATVSSSGQVTGVKAGQVTITASCSGYTDASITLWVTVPEGVYYLKNASSGLCMETVVDTAYVYTQNTNATARVSQLWKISYVSNGNYIIRPLGDFSLAMTVGDSGYVTVEKDSSASAGIYWQISHNAFGYAFKHGGSNSKTAMPTVNGPTGVPVYPSSWTSSLTCHWELEKIQGVFLRDTTTQKVVLSSTAKSIELDDTPVTLSDLGLSWEYYGSLMGVSWSSSKSSVATVNASGTVTCKGIGETVITINSVINGTQYSQSFTLSVSTAENPHPFQREYIQYIRYTRITDTSSWDPDKKVDHTISIVKSSLLTDDYCIVVDNINVGYYRHICINNDLKNTLTSLETGYQDHYNIIPGFNTSTLEENLAHKAKQYTDNLVDAGYFLSSSSEYWGVWAFNYTSLSNLFDYWIGVLDTTTKAYNVYLAATSFYRSYLYTANIASTNVSSTQYISTTSYLDDLDDAISATSYTDKTVISAEARNTAIEYSNPPYKPGTPVVGYKTAGTAQYVRVYTEGVSNASGRWVMRYSDIQGLTAAQIKDKFALPYLPTHYCFVNIPSGVQMYAGIANDIAGWGSGGVIQFEIVNYLPSWFGNGIPLA